MSKFTNPLDNVSIASPCSQDWNAMIGNERTRYCGDCKLNVYNLSGMSRAEAENLILNAEGRLCVRFYKRADGTVLTKDCPVGWQAVKRRISRTAAAAFSLLVGLVGGLGFSTAFNSSGKEIKIGRFLPVFSPTPDRILMGNMSVPTPTPKPKATATPNYQVVGMIANTPRNDKDYTMGKPVVSKN